MAKLIRLAPEVPVSDLHGAVEYYEQKLGFKVVMEIPERDYAIVERDGIAIHLFQGGSPNHSPLGMHIFTHQLDELYAELQQRNAAISQPIIRKPWGNREFRVADHSGNEIKFTEPIGAHGKKQQPGRKNFFAQT